MTTKPAPAAVIANLEVLTNKLRDIFEANAEHANAMQKRFVDALMAIANFLKQSGVEEDIAHKLAELAAAVSDLRRGTVADFLRPAVVGGRGPDGRAARTGPWPSTPGRVPDACPQRARNRSLAGHSRDAAACLGPLVDGTGGHLGVAWADPRTARIAKRFCRLAGGRRLGMATNGGNGQR
jgi:hypothetical protein